MEKIKDYIQLRVTNHRVMAEKLYNETKAMVEQPIYGAQLLKRYQPNEAAKLMQKAIDDSVAKQIAVDMIYNAEVKDIIKKARKASLPDAVRNFTPPADYQLQINNALSFLSAAGSKLTDDEAFEILKPFFNDWGKMRMFESVIVHSSEPGVDNKFSVRDRLPNALGGVLNIADVHESIFNEAEKMAELLFMSKKQHTMTAYLEGFAFKGAVVCDNYEDRSAQDRILVLADKIERFSTDGVLTLDTSEKDTDFIWE